MSCDACKDRKPGEFVETTEDLRCVACGEDIKFQVPMTEKSIPKDMLKAAEILDKKALEWGHPHSSVFLNVAKALRGEE